VKPCETLAPYDCQLSALSPHEQKSLSERVAQQASVLFDSRCVEIDSICGKEYDDLLEDAGVAFHRRSEFALPIGKKLRALDDATDPNKTERLLDASYKIIWRLAKQMGMRRLRDILNDDIPDSGVYLFFDEQETRLKDIGQLRIVRVGTHGVAAGSKASLRSRMRTHLGTASGEGNHRSSIFRLHAGRALITPN
jgi:hypothetical protein